MALARDDVLDDSVYKSYSTSMTMIHDKAKKYYHDSEFPNEDLPMHELMFVLRPGIVGTNRAFNDVEGMYQWKIIIFSAVVLLTLSAL